MNKRNHFKSGFLRAALMLLLAVMTFPLEAWAGNLNYIDENGVEQEIPSTVTPTKITSETTSLDDTSQNAGWYYVEDEVSINGSMNIKGNVNINGGQVTATGRGIYANNITLGWTNADDFIKASSYNAERGLKIADGKTLYIGTTAYSGTVSDPSTIAGKRLTPDLWGITSGNDGSETKPYTITNTAGLDLLAKMVNGTDGYAANDFSGKYFVLGNDITYTHLDASETGADTENNYTAIGGYYSNFKGTFDGQGHTVSGIRIYKNSSDREDKYQGLFGNFVDGTVCHVTLDDAQITGYNFTGSIVGYNNEGNITDCHVTENVCISAQQNTLYHGGIVGNNDGSVSGCTSKAKIKINSSSSFEFGGIAGCNDDGTIKDCLYPGSVVEGGETSNNVGAITGSNKTDGSIINCYYTNEDFMGQVTPGTPPDNNAIGENSVTATNTGLARTITLGEGVTLSGTAADYGPASPNTSDVRITSYATAADQPGFALKLETVSGTTTTTTYYSTSGATVALGYSGTVPTGSALNYKATKTSGGTDVTSTVISGSTLTMPDYDVSITAEVKEPVAYAVLSDNEDGEGTKSLTFKYGAHTLATTNEWNVSNTGSDPLGWEDQCSSITKVVFDESFANARPKNCFHWFYGCANLTAITGLNNFNTSEVADMSGMFNGCSSLTSLDLSNFNTSEVTDMNHMFHYCSGLTSITFGEHFSTSKVGNMDNMFSGCTALANGTLTVKGDAAPTISQDIFSVFKYGTLVTDLTASDLGVTENTTGSNAGYFTWKGGKFVAHNNRVSYLDENGDRQFHDGATRITDTSTSLNGGWYYASGNGTINDNVDMAVDADVHLILADGSKMTVTVNSNAIECNGNLTIYGQSTGDDMGRLTINPQQCGIAINCSGNLTINGGQINASSDWAETISADGDITINGGQVTATGTNSSVIPIASGKDITINGGQVTATGTYGFVTAFFTTITLGWRNSTDFIQARNYEGTVKIPAGKGFYYTAGDNMTFLGNATNDYVFGAEGNATLGDIANKKLIPALPIDASQSYFMRTFDGNWKPIVGGKTFLPDGYDLAKGVVTLKEVAGAPDGQPVIFGPEDEQQPSAQYFVVGASGDEAKTIQDDYDNVVKNMGDRFVISDGTKTLAEVISGTGVDASEAIVLMLVNSKFTTVDFSADDLGKKTKAGLLLFVLSKWEYMQIKPSTQPISAPQSTRAIGIDFGNDFTGVKEVKEVREVKEDWYSLDGRKLDKAPTKKGVYIRSGVKVIIK